MHEVPAPAATGEQGCRACSSPPVTWLQELRAFLEIGLINAVVFCGAGRRDGF